MNTTRRQGTRPEIPKSTEAVAPLSASFVEEGEAFMKLSGRAPERVTADRSQRESFEVVVIGGGQAGLSLGYHLAKRGFRFVILDASARVGDTWRSRWDSLRLFTPARYDSLDGMPFPAPPHSFPTKDGMADYLERYAKRFALPIRNAARVDRLRKEGRRYVVTVGEQEIETDQVVVAMANYQRPKVPDFARSCAPTSSSFTLRSIEDPHSCARAPSWWWARVTPGRRSPSSSRGTIGFGCRVGTLDTCRSGSTDLQHGFFS